MTEIELITKALKDAYKFVKEQEQTKETGELLINLFKAEILVKNCSIPAVSNRREQLIAFAQWLAHEEEYGKDGSVGTVDAYLESN